MCRPNQCFRRHLAGRQSGQKSIHSVLYGYRMANNLFSNIHFAQLVNRNFAILGSRLYF